MYHPKITGDRVFLATMNPEDVSLYMKWVNDMDVALGINIASEIIHEEMERQTLIQIRDSNRHFAIVCKETGEAIGNCGFPKLEQISGYGEVGIFIGDEKYRNGGFGTEALRLLCDYGFHILNLHVLYLKVFSFNRQAISCYQKVGFQMAGKVRQAIKIAGKRYDEVLMDLLCEEFTSPYVADILKKKNQDIL